MASKWMKLDAVYASVRCENARGFCVESIAHLALRRMTWVAKSANADGSPLNLGQLGLGLLEHSKGDVEQELNLLDYISL